jgi:hypothetical protein
VHLEEVAAEEDLKKDRIIMQGEARMHRSTAIEHKELKAAIVA